MTRGPSRFFSPRRGQDTRAWPLLGLLLVVIVAAIGGVLWFMREAMQNERLAVREKLAEAYRGHLSLVQQRIEEKWREGLERIDAASENGSALFAAAARKDWSESVICLAEDGSVLYPRSEGIARVAAANEELLAVEREPGNPAAVETLQRRLNRYEGEALPASQRLFLMHELQGLAPGVTLPTLAAEDLAAQVLEAGLPTERMAASVAQRLGTLGWGVRSPKGRALALFSTPVLRARLEQWAAELPLPAGVQIASTAPGEEVPEETTLLTAPLAPNLPGWRLALRLDDRTIFDSTAGRRIAGYLWVGSILIAGVTVLAFFVARGLQQQMQVAQLKNDLVATVSHELKTPLTAMRALVETLLDTEELNPATTREYLQLVAQENARLSRLIEHFLTFSRLERGRFAFDFSPVAPGTIVTEALAALGERASAVEMQTAAGLPALIGDREALVTALLNLLDNAWKYSGETKRIILRTTALGANVAFAVEDNGIGLSAADCRKVFRQFYQANQRLSRTVGGCGLGLNIVQSIVEAHDGRVQVASTPGEGSTFTIEIPGSR